MNINQIRDAVNKNKKCDKCGADNKSGDWLVSFTLDKAVFECKRCGFSKKIKIK